MRCRMLPTGWRPRPKHSDVCGRVVQRPRSAEQLPELVTASGSESLKAALNMLRNTNRSDTP